MLSNLRCTLLHLFGQSMQQLPHLGLLAPHAWHFLAQMVNEEAVHTHATNPVGRQEVNSGHAR